MNEFKVISTQEEFDAAISERLRRERESNAKKYEGYISPEEFETKAAEFRQQIGDLTTQLNGANEKIANHDHELAERDIKIKAYESLSVKTRIANDLGLSHKAVDFLQGDDEDSIRKSAESLKALVGINYVAPLASTETVPSDDTDAAYRRTLKNMEGE